MYVYAYYLELIKLLELCFVAVENAVYAGDLSVPFDTVFHPGGAYSSSKHSFWIPNIDINVVIEGYKKEEFQHILNPYLYVLIFFIHF